MEAAKKECILTEAARAFARFGFRKTAIDDIARGAGVAKGSVYLAAESKEDLFFQVLHREVRAWVAECSKIIDPRVPADELLGRLLAAAISNLDQRPLVKELLLGEAQELLPAWRDRLAELRRLGGANIAEVLRLGIKQKVFRPDLDVDLLAPLLQDFELGAYIFHPELLHDATALRERARVGLDLVLNGLRTKAHAR